MFNSDNRFDLADRSINEDAGLQRFMLGVYLYMAGGLAMTGAVAYATAASGLYAAIAGTPLFWVVLLAPLAVVPLAPSPLLIPAVAVTSLACLALLGALGARAGSAPIGPALMRVTFWGMLAMAVTAGVGNLFGAA